MVYLPYIFTYKFHKKKQPNVGKSAIAYYYLMSVTILRTPAFEEEKKPAWPFCTPCWQDQNGNPWRERPTKAIKRVTRDTVFCLMEGLKGVQNVHDWKKPYRGWKTTQLYGDYIGEDSSILGTWNLWWTWLLFWGDEKPTQFMWGLFQKPMT